MTESALEKKAKEDKDQAESAGSVVSLPRPPVVLPMEELYVYKLQVLDRDFKDAQIKVATPLKKAYQQRLLETIQKAISEDEDCQKAHENRAACIDELIDSLGDNLPNDYKLVKIDPDRKELTAVYSPDEDAKEQE